MGTYKNVYVRASRYGDGGGDCNPDPDVTGFVIRSCQEHPCSGRLSMMLIGTRILSAELKFVTNMY